MRIYSIIIPVYNRPDELDDLLASLCRQTYVHFEVIVVEDGSTVPARAVVERYRERLDMCYLVIENSGPGIARNRGAERARGEYLLILDSDVTLPAAWLEQVHDALRHYPVDAFGGPDRAHPSFTPVQRAINYAMTFFLTTGGIRGGRRKLDTFYPRSFNMGIKREVYHALGGFSGARYGEDIDFSLRIVEAGYRVRLFPAAWVYHKEADQPLALFSSGTSFGRGAYLAEPVASRLVEGGALLARRLRARRSPFVGRFFLLPLLRRSLGGLFLLIVYRRYLAEQGRPVGRLPFHDRLLHTIAWLWDGLLAGAHVGSRERSRRAG